MAYGVVCLFTFSIRRPHPITPLYIISLCSFEIVKIVIIVWFWLFKLQNAQKKVKIPLIKT